MSTTQVARRYATAIFNAASEAGGKLEPLVKQLRSFEAALAESAELRGVLHDANRPLEARRAVLVEVLKKGRVPELERNTLCVVLERGRLALLSDILAVLDELVAAQEARLDVKVESAVALSAADQKKIKAEVERITGKTAAVTSSVNPALLGGVVVRFGNTVLDGSLKSQLAALGERLQAP
jgi:F-type H+-transporting ATPase subunit delta